MRQFARKLIRYATVSVISTCVTLSILALLVGTGSLSAGWANVVGTAAGTIPSFELNRRWVWSRRGPRSLLAEVGPFWVLSFTGLGLSTLAVHTATAWVVARGLGAGTAALVADAANVATFGSLWVVQYLLLDRLLFRAPAKEEQFPAFSQETLRLR